MRLCLEIWPTMPWPIGSGAGLPGSMTTTGMEKSMPTNVTLDPLLKERAPARPKKTPRTTVTGSKALRSIVVLTVACFLSGCTFIVAPPEGYGIPLPSLSELPQALADESRRFRSHPAGEFILRLYAEERPRSRSPKAESSSSDEGRA